MPRVIAHSSGGALVENCRDAMLMDHLRQHGFHVVEDTEGIVAFPGGAMPVLEELVNEFYNGGGSHE